jgi:hypothetical protein
MAAVVLVVELAFLANPATQVQEDVSVLVDAQAFQDDLAKMV